jgi:hypothetical protein
MNVPGPSSPYVPALNFNQYRNSGLRLWGWD